MKIGGKIRYRPDGTPLPQIATPVFGYKSHISIDQRYGFIRKAAVTSAAGSDGRQLRRVIDTNNTASAAKARERINTPASPNPAWLAHRTASTPARDPKGTAHKHPRARPRASAQDRRLCD